jgi:hypothetical protein
VKEKGSRQRKEWRERRTTDWARIKWEAGGRDKMGDVKKTRKGNKTRKEVQ